ncbi:MAG: hypothetical protein NC340_10130 [Ruminococcus flavefaciens]|nr:hypothetical protein [Ruminococcus flavefaciens]MCM1232808.1 hypothetical protein [Ruminococcus flavefaciens]
MFNEIGDEMGMEVELNKYVGKKITVCLNVMEVHDNGYGYAESIKGNLEKVGKGWILLGEGQYRRIINLANVTYIKL